MSETETKTKTESTSQATLEPEKATLVKQKKTRASARTKSPERKSISRARVAEAKTVTISLRPESADPPQKGAMGFDGIWLQPGVNHVKLSQYNILLAYEDWKYVNDMGIVKVISEDAPTEITTLSGLSTTTALDVIDVERDETKLKEWRKIEGQTLKRDAIINQLSRQLARIEKGTL